MLRIAPVIILPRVETGVVDAIGRKTVKINGREMYLDQGSSLPTVGDRVDFIVNIEDFKVIAYIFDSAIRNNRQIRIRKQHI